MPTDPMVTAWLVIAASALPLLAGLHRIYMRNGINARAFSAQCAKLLTAGNPDRFEKLLTAAGDPPIVQLVSSAWRERAAANEPEASFGGYRQTERGGGYAERLGPTLQPHVAKVRRTLGTPIWLTLPGLLPLPLLALVLQRVSLDGPWVVAAIMALLTALAFNTVSKQKNQIEPTLAKLVPLFEPYAQQPAGSQPARS
jgi:hypothetical protein